MYGHQWSQAIPALAIKACLLATKSHILNFCEVCATICCNFDLWEPTTQDTKRFFLSSETKRTKLKTKRNITTVGKLLFLTQYRMRYTIYIPPNTKDLVINLTKVAYGNRQNAITFAGANNSDLLWALKHLMETRLFNIALLGVKRRQSKNTTSQNYCNKSFSTVVIILLKIESTNHHIGYIALVYRQ